MYANLGIITESYSGNPIFYIRVYLCKCTSICTSNVCCTVSGGAAFLRWVDSEEGGGCSKSCAECGWVVSMSFVCVFIHIYIYTCISRMCTLNVCIGVGGQSISFVSLWLTSAYSAATDQSTELPHNVTCCNTPQHNILHCNNTHCQIPRCRAEQRTTAVQSIEQQHNASHCNNTRCNTPRCGVELTELLHTALHCNNTQHIAMLYKTLRHSATHSKVNQSGCVHKQECMHSKRQLIL